MPTADRQDRWDWLLTWASEMGAGGWAEWKDACGELGIEPNEAARVLSQLGHVEFDRGGDTFASAAGTLVGIAGLDGLFFLTGARTFGTVEQLRELASQSGLDVEVAAPVGQGGRGPSTVLVECALEAVEEFAEAAGLILEGEAERLAGLLPRTDLGLVGELRAPDLRYPHCRMDHVSLRPQWGTPSGDEEPGLWLVRGLRRYEFYLRERDDWWHIPIREFAPYLVSVELADPPLIEYEEATWLLHVRSCAALPPLHARAATLCSGRLPIRRPRADEYLETYVNVGPGSAASIMSSLGFGDDPVVRGSHAAAGVAPAEGDPGSASNELRRDDARLRPGLAAARKLLDRPEAFGVDDLEDFSIFKGIVGVAFKHDRPWKRAWQLLNRPPFAELRRAYEPISKVRALVLEGDRERLLGISAKLRVLGVAEW
ncbi:MAG: hypothetical protein WCN81_11645, partial [Actinomycetes bacterium]